MSRVLSQLGQDGRVRVGVLQCVGAYFLWALFPLYFRLLERSGAFEVIAARVTFSCLVCFIAITVLRQWKQLVKLARDRRVWFVMGLAGILITINWTVYVYGVNTGRTLDAALGYFINPLVIAMLGVLVLKERLKPAQWVAFGFGAAACVVIAVGYGQVPWIAFTLAGSFGLYGLVKKRVGAKVPPLAGLTFETTVVTPIALVYVAFLATRGGLTALPTEPYGWLVYLAGPITVIPLLLFAAGAAKVELVTVGIVQYIAPIGQFLVGWLVFAEPMPLSRWIGFVLVWISVSIFAISAYRQWRIGVRSRPTHPPG